MRKAIPLTIAFMLLMSLTLPLTTAWQPSETLEATEDHSISLDSSSELTNLTSYSEQEEEWVDVVRDEINYLEEEVEVDSIEARAEDDSAYVDIELNESDEFTYDTRDDRLKSVPSDTDLTLKLEDTEDLGSDNITIDWSDDTKDSNNITIKGDDSTSTSSTNELQSNELMASPTEIHNWDDLYDVRYNRTDDYILMTDLDSGDPGYEDYNSGDGWQPIGDDSNTFDGTFDGNGHKIEDLYIDRSDEYYVGLFGYIGSSGEIKDLKLKNNNIHGSSYVGGISGYNEGQIMESYTSGSIVAGSQDSAGITGKNDGIINRTSSHADVDYGSGVSPARHGGIVGYNTGTVRNVYYDGSMTFWGDDVGGITGLNKGTVENTYGTGTMTDDSDGSNGIGGVVGYNYDTGEVIDSIGDWDMWGEAVGDNSGTETGRVTQTDGDIEMQDIGLYTDDDYGTFDPLNEPWDMAKNENWVDEIWRIDNDNDLPKLSSISGGLYNLTISIDGEGSELNYGEGTHKIEEEDKVTLEAESSSFSEFSNWTGYTSSEDKIVSFDMPSEDTTMTATFNTSEYIEADDDENYWNSVWFYSDYTREVTNITTLGQNYTVYYRNSTSDSFTQLDVGDRCTDLQLRVELDYAGDYMTTLAVDLDRISQVNFTLQGTKYTDWEEGDSDTFSYSDIEQLNLTSHNDGTVFSLDMSLKNYPKLTGDEVPNLDIDFVLEDDSGNVLATVTKSMNNNDTSTFKFNSANWDNVTHVGADLDMTGLVDADTSATFTTHTTINWEYLIGDSATVDIYDMLTSYTFWTMAISIFIGMAIAIGFKNPQAGVGGYLIFTLIFGVWGWIHWLVPFLSILLFGTIYAIMMKKGGSNTLPSSRNFGR